MQRTYDLGADGVGFYDYPAVFSGSLSAGANAMPSDFFAAIDTPPPPPPPPGPGNVLDDFEVDEGHFGWVSQSFAAVADQRPDR